jgi:hypothetical protein
MFFNVGKYTFSQSKSGKEKEKFQVKIHFYKSLEEK